MLKHLTGEGEEVRPVGKADLHTEQHAAADASDWWTHHVRHLSEQEPHEEPKNPPTVKALPAENRRHRAAELRDAARILSSRHVPACRG